MITLLQANPHNFLLLILPHQYDVLCEKTLCHYLPQIIQPTEFGGRLESSLPDRWIPGSLFFFVVCIRLFIRHSVSRAAG